MITFIIIVLVAIPLAFAIGQFFGNILGGIVCFIDELLEMFPLPLPLTRLLVAIGTSWLAFMFASFLGLIPTILWWIYYYIVCSADNEF